SRTGNTTRPSGSGALEAITLYVPPGCGTQRIGEPSGYRPVWAIGRSKVVPTRRNFPSGDSTAMVGTRSVFSCVFTVYRSGGAVGVPPPSPEFSRTGWGPNESVR